HGALRAASGRDVPSESLIRHARLGAHTSALRMGRTCPCRSARARVTTHPTTEAAMRASIRTVLAGFCLLLVAAPTDAQQPQRDAELVARRHALEEQLQSIAVVERKLMIPMRDGTRLATDVYRPRNADGPVPTIFVRTPYNVNYWDVRLGAPRDMSSIINAVERGYAYVSQNERGHFFSEGNWEILGAPLT